jgi:hypothetical protein
MERSMSLNTHPFMETLKKGKQEREAKKAEQAPTPKVEIKLSQSSNDLFNKYKNHFSGGFGRYDYKVQRALWDEAIRLDCVENLKATMEFFHGTDKPAACQSAAQKRMTDTEYSQWLIEEAMGEKRRLEREKAEREKQRVEALERKRRESCPEWQAQEAQRKESRRKKILEIKAKMKRL